VRVRYYEDLIAKTAVAVAEEACKDDQLSPDEQAEAATVGWF
jgi:hypothetical protein